MTEVATVQHGNALAVSGEQSFWNDHQIAALRQLGVDRATNGDLAVFHHVCQRTGLDPFARQIYMIERQGKQTIQTGIDGYRLVARRAVDRTREALSIGSPEWCGPDKVWTDVWLDEQPPVAARILIKRGTGEFPGIALWSEYAQTDNNGRPKATWASRGAGMLAKCAEALALRKAFPQDLSGVYVEDELHRSDVVRAEVVHPSGLAAALNDSDPDPGEPSPPVEPDGGAASGGSAAPEGESSGSESPLLSNRTKFGKAFYARVADRKFETDAARLEYIVETIGRFIESTKEMTEAEARIVLARLDEEDGVTQ